MLDFVKPWGLTAYNVLLYKKNLPANRSSRRLEHKVPVQVQIEAVLFGNPVGSLHKLCIFSGLTFSKSALQKCGIYKEVVQKLKFPNNSTE